VTTRGLPNAARVAQGYTNCRLDCGLEEQRPRPLPSSGNVCALYCFSFSFLLWLRISAAVFFVSDSLQPFGFAFLSGRNGYISKRAFGCGSVPMRDAWSAFNDISFMNDLNGACLG
jgi:hypothetical protein